MTKNRKEFTMKTNVRNHAASMTSVSANARLQPYLMRAMFAILMRAVFILVAAFFIGIYMPAKAEAASMECRVEPGKVYGLSEAIELGHVRVVASSNGTYREVDYTVFNLRRERIRLRFDAGMYFRNPDRASQNLVTLQNLGEFVLAESRSKSVTVASACTNAELKVPGRLDAWSHGDAPLGIDHAIRFYGKHQKAIDGWLAKKSPEHFSTADGRQVFLQLVIWAYLDAQYDDILRMLAGTVFKDDLVKAEKFIKEFYESAKEISALIKERNTRAMADWARRAIAENVDADAIRERGRGLWQKARGRFGR